MEYEPVIGLEVHAQMSTKSKIFCGCSTQFGQDPNSLTCPVCLGMPGALPVLNKQVVEAAMKTALATNCTIQSFNRFARKNHCLCPDCRRAFSKEADIRLQFDLEQILMDPELETTWLDWRSKIMINGFKKVVDEVWEVNRDLDLAITVDLEPEVGLDKGAYEVFGQNYAELAELTGHSLVHILPFSPILPDIGSEEYQKFIKSGKFTEQIRAKEYNQSILYWGPIKEQEYEFVKKAGEDLNASRIMIYPAYPGEYNDIRESHLGFY